MARIYKGTYTIGYLDDTKTQGVDEFFENLEAAFEEAGIEYEKEYTEASRSTDFYLFDRNVKLKFYQFGGIVYEQDPNPKIVISRNILCNLNNITGVDLQQKYEIIVSSYGDVMLRVSRDYSPAFDLVNNDGVVFVICKCNNVIEPSESGYGLYAPWEMPNLSSDGGKQDHTPKFFLTADTDMSDLANNTGAAGNRAIATYTYITNNSAPITALVPIFAVSSQCVSINTKIMAIAPSPITGYAVLNGQRYYCVGQVCMADDEE